MNLYMCVCQFPVPHGKMGGGRRGTWESSVIPSVVPQETNSRWDGKVFCIPLLPCTIIQPVHMPAKFLSDPRSRFFLIIL